MLPRSAILAAVASVALGSCCLEPSGSDTTGSSSTTVGSSTSGSSSTGGSSGSTGGSPGSTSGGELCPPTKPIFHRPVAVACDGGNTNPFPGSENQCLQDGDCLANYPDTLVCSCAPQTRQGGGSTVDWCVPGDCSIDSDCICGYCSPTYDLNCGSFRGFVGYYCHTETDTCINDDECDGGYCAYSSQVAHWVCGYGFCAG